MVENYIENNPYSHRIFNRGLNVIALHRDGLQIL